VEEELKDVPPPPKKKDKKKKEKRKTESPMDSKETSSKSPLKKLSVFSSYTPNTKKVSIDTQGTVMERLDESENDLSGFDVDSKDRPTLNENSLKTQHDSAYHNSDKSKVDKTWIARHQEGKDNGDSFEIDDKEVAVPFQPNHGLDLDFNGEGQKKKRSITDPEIFQQKRQSIIIDVDDIEDFNPYSTEECDINPYNNQHASPLSNNHNRERFTPHS
jgi:hypothetical protein